MDAAAEFYVRAGFTVGSRNRHPWGTHNRIVQYEDLLFRDRPLLAAVVVWALLAVTVLYLGR